MYYGLSTSISAIADAWRLCILAHIPNTVQPGWSQLQLSPKYCRQTT
jgi:hypothetical protein